MGASECNVCNEKAVRAFLECARCESSIHYNCTELPPYFIFQIETSKLDYYCCECTSLKVQNQKQIKKIAEEIEIQEDDEDDSESGDDEDENQAIDPDSIKTSEVSNKEPTLDKERKQVNGGDKKSDKTTLEKTPNNNTRQEDKISDKPHKRICKFYLQNKCKHGKSGKDCSFEHPIRCRNLRTARGCKKGDACKFWHPKTCKYGHNCKIKKTCKLVHPNGPTKNFRQAPKTNTTDEIQTIAAIVQAVLKLRSQGG